MAAAGCGRIQPPIFDKYGPTSFSEFRSELYDFLNYTNSTLENAKRMLPTILRGDARIIYQSLPEDARMQNTVGMDDLMILFEDRLFTEPEVELLKDELKNLKQNGRPVHTFAQEIRRAAEKAYPGGTDAIALLRDREAKEAFISGLDDSFRIDVRKATPAHFHQAVRAAMQMESINRKEKKDEKIDSLIQGVSALLSSTRRPYNSSTNQQSHQNWNRQWNNNTNYNRNQQSAPWNNYFRGRGRGGQRGMYNNNYNNNNYTNYSNQRQRGWSNNQQPSGNNRGRGRGFFGGRGRGNNNYRVNQQDVIQEEDNSNNEDYRPNERGGNTSRRRGINGLFLSSLLSIVLLFSPAIADSDFHNLQFCQSGRGGILVRPPPLPDCSFQVPSTPIIRTNVILFVENSTVEEMEAHKCMKEQVELCVGHFLLIRSTEEKKIISRTAPTKEQCQSMIRDRAIDGKVLEKNGH